ncbi:flavin reductase family protein [Pseudomonas aeruginosa]|uniref:flavin reductase family protein n=1 Tax=Pseudomonas aeruginosa TaxID=287 RepID=UPI0037482A5A|nr:flavin reductase [Pseudomonas aeruginosa]HBP6060955.1 flavin reductase [Pseudomonas aeruginosa]HBP6170145.1 flavin reductase [Pseudomonas aeruginosa]HBP6483580.1 flavin reductase [Pseudomonas aeruginosa]
MTTQSAAVDAKQFRRVMGKFATGVTVITFKHEGKVVGMTANAFMSLSMDPPMVLISVRTQSRFASSVGKGDGFGIAFLREEHEHLSRHFGGRPDPDLSLVFDERNGTPLLPDALVQLAVRANSIHAGGDHLIYTADIESIQEADGRPLLFFSGGYKQLHALDPSHCWSDFG